MEYDQQKIQNAIGYHFKNPDLLAQAFTRRSYSQENGGQNNEVLEFIGDKALDLAVIIKTTEWFGTTTDNKKWKEFKLKNPEYFKTKSEEGVFTDIKKDLVQKKTLATCIENLGFHLMLFMSEGDYINDVNMQDSVKEDLFEAIVGAVAIDSNYDMEKVVSVVDAMIDFDDYFSNWNEFNINYVGLLQEWAQSNDIEVPEYSYKDLGPYYYDEILCTVEFRLPNGQLKNFQGRADSKSRARKEAAKIAYKYLQDNNYVVSIYEDAVGYPDEREAIRQVNELAQKDLIEKPTYEYQECQDEYEDTVWECTLKADGIGEFQGSAYTKKEAQRNAAYNFLMGIMGYEDEQD